MYVSDLFYLVRWWGVLFGIGVLFLPLTAFFFRSFFDKGYLFSKILGISFISYVVFLLGTFKIFPFTLPTIFLIVGLSLGINILIIKIYYNMTMKEPARNEIPRDAGVLNRKTIRIFLFEELLFFLALLCWSYIKGTGPDIHGLEKYMDFGFVNSILRSEFFPPKDMWFTPFTINYYYFGHLTTAVLTKLSGIDSAITFNIMLATIFAFTFTGSFSIGLNLYNAFLATTETQKKKEAQKLSVSKIFSASAVAGFLSAFIVSLGGNLHTIYSFFKPYQNENPLPFWQLPISSDTFPNVYWYPNATRFIHNTIHEFPLYSFVVSDLHGHVLDIPLVLLTIALLLSVMLEKTNQYMRWKLGLLGFLLAIMYMTNVWDGIIYFMLTTLVILYINAKPMFKNIHHESIKYYVASILRSNNYILHTTYYILLLGATFIIFSLPFSLYFKPFASGIGILCAPEFLTKIGDIGPFLFEKDHCQRSPLWQLVILHGFYYFWAIFGIYHLVKSKKNTPGTIFSCMLLCIATLLVLIPEFVYVKDIYPAHYRANTMFKLVYQAFIMLSLVSGYVIIVLLNDIKHLLISGEKYLQITIFFVGIAGLLLVSLYPYLAIKSYYGNLHQYRGLNGAAYLKTLYPSDYEAIRWLNTHIHGQPVILEAQGDSYTDYGRVSANTGLPTVLGWTVHEWLWRGTYDIPAPRITEVKTLYEASSKNETKTLIRKYNISLVMIGDLERQKYPLLNEEKFQILGKLIYQHGQTKIYQINSMTP